MINGSLLAPFYYLFAVVGLLTAAFLAASSAASFEEPSTKRSSTDDIETGKVSWSRDFRSAQQESKITGKPIFLQFQEIPG
ncbi:MAG: hypothetical protein AAFN77_03400 [Planctomycetota bacterium]